MTKYIEKYIGICFITLSIFSSVLIFNTKKTKYMTKFLYNKNILNNIKADELQINDLVNEKNSLETKVIENNNKISDIKNKLEDYVITEDEFKKIMYSLASKSGLKLIKITKKQQFSNFFEYSLCYSNVQLKGDLSSLGRFLYYINHIPKHIDTSKFSLSVNQDNQILNLGYIEKKVV